MIESVELFSDLSARELADIEKIATRRTFVRGDLIFKQGEHSRDLYVIESGQVEILIKTPMQDHKVVSTLRNGDLLGEMAMFDRNSARSASARATQNTNVIMIPGADFERLLKERPTLSFKLLGTLSRRLRQMNTRDKNGVAPTDREGKVIVVASPRDGTGKTSFAATVAHLLSSEADKRVVYLDLDLTFADGTFFMGVYSIRSCIDMASSIGGESMDWSDVRKYVIAHNEQLFTLPGPVSLIDGERLRGEDLVKIIRVFRRHVDYVVVDTESKISDAFLGALDLADHVYFLVDVHDLYSLKTSARYFHGIGRLNLPEQRLTLLACHAERTFAPAEMAKLFKLPVGGQLPKLIDYAPQYGVTPYVHAPSSDYCQAVRGLLARTFRVNFPAAENKGFFARLFTGSDGKPQHASSSGTAGGGNAGTDPAIIDTHLSVLLKYVRLNLKNGQIQEARQQVTQLLGYCTNSSYLYQTYGEVLSRERNHSEAVSAFQRSLQLNPDNHVALANLGVLGRNDTMIEQARTLLRQRIATHPRWPDQYVELGVLEYRVGNIDAAIAQFMRALEINPTYTDASVWLAEAHFSQDQIGKAIEVLAHLEDKSVRGYVLLGDCLHADGRLADALNAYQRAAEINPNYEELSEKIHGLEKHFDQLHHLIEMHRGLVGTHKNHPDLHLKLGELLVQVGHRDEAAKALRTALKLKSDLPAATKLLADLDRQEKCDLHLHREPSSKKPIDECPGTTCEHYRIELRNGTAAGVALDPTRLEHRRLRLCNVRTGRSHEMRLNGSLLSNATTLINPHPLCPIEENDVILATILEPATNVATFTWPIPVVSTPADQGPDQIIVDLAVPLAALGGELGAAIPAPFFLLTCDRQSVGGEGNGQTRVSVINPRTKMVVDGMIDPEQPEVWQFVLLGESGEDIVNAGDHLVVQRFDENGTVVAELPLTITSDDLRTFQKSAGIDRH